MTTTEERIMGYILDGTASQFARAVSLLRKDYDRKALRELGHKRRCTGRLMKTIHVADQLLSGELKSDQRRDAILTLAASAGHAVKRRSTSSPCRPRSRK